MTPDELRSAIAYQEKREAEFELRNKLHSHYDSEAEITLRAKMKKHYDQLAELVGAMRLENPNPTTMTPQPISTAPKGQRILLYCKRPIESGGWWQIGMLCPDVRRWIDDDYEPDWMLVQPSFWLPLPQPPQPQ